MGFRRDPLRELDRVARSLLRSHPPSSSIPLLAVRNADDLRLAFDLPGVDPATIELTVRGDAVAVQAKRRAEPWEPSEGDAEEGRVVIDDRGPTDLGREVTFDDGLVPDSARAEYRDGVLTVTVGLRPDAEGHRVPVTLVGDRAQSVDAAAGPAAEEPSAEAAEAAEAFEAAKAAVAADAADAADGTGPLAPPPPAGQQANPLPTS
jgi:HSP20 family protein